MLQDERLEEIVTLLKNNQTVKIVDLAERFGVTRETIRRDLYELEKRGHARKVHGGARFRKSGSEPPFMTRSDTYVKEKEAIARKAVELVEDGDSLFIDIGTTTFLFASQLKKKSGLQIVTNSVKVAMELFDHPSAKVILCGGELRQEELSLSGPEACRTVESFFADKAFIGVGGLSLAHGITDYHVEEAGIRRLMMQRAKETVALADGSKFGNVAFAKVTDLAKVHTVITDRQADEDTIRGMREIGIEVLQSDD